MTTPYSNLSTVLGIEVKEVKMLKLYFLSVQKNEFFVFCLVFVLFIGLTY